MRCSAAASSLLTHPRRRARRNPTGRSGARPSREEEVVWPEVGDLVAQEVVLDGDVDGVGLIAARDDDVVAARRQRKRLERETAGQLDHVLLAATVAKVADDVFAVRRGSEGERVVPASAQEHVIALAPDDVVISAKARQVVVARAAP